MFQKVFYGPVTNPMLEKIKDIKGWEKVMVGSLVVLAFWGGLYPSTFLKPMEKAIAATRQMALNPPGQRPTWNDDSLEVDDHGNLVRIDQTGNVQETVAVADAHWAIPMKEETQ
jgi:hypothetical protein